MSDRLKENQIDKAAAERTLEPTAKEAYEKASQKLRRKILHGVITRDTDGLYTVNADSAKLTEATLRACVKKRGWEEQSVTEEV